MLVRVPYLAISLSLVACFFAVNARATSDADNVQTILHTASPPLVPPAPSFVRPKSAVQASHCQTPAYPRRALVESAQGTTQVRIGFGPEGRVVSTEVLTSSGASEAHKLLDQAAIASQQTCTLEPESGALIRYAVRSITFALQEEAPTR
ncbi:TonB family protein [Ramlibacter sp.]